MNKTKTINTRIQLKYDSYSNWTRMVGEEGPQVAFWSTFTPKKGEICFFNVPASTEAVPSEPAILFKVGDGIKTLEALPWGSAIAADVYEWAKKQSLEWSDLSNDFTTALQEFVEAHSVSDTYSIVETSEGSNIFQLQKTDKDGASTLVGEQINLSNIYSELNKKVDRLIENADGSKALIFNETDGGGAKFENSDGSWSFVGVNQGEKGVVLYDIDANKTGARINMANGKAYYYTGTNKSAAELDAATGLEIATKDDIAAINIPDYTIVKQATAEEGYISTYNLIKDGTAVGASINIPKDFLVKSAEIKTVAVEDDPYEGAQVGDKYIDFEINVKEGTAEAEHLYLPVNDLVDVYTAGNGIEISETNVISTKAIQVTVNGEVGTYTGQANVPVYFDITPAADKVTVNSYSIELGGEDNQTAKKYSMDVPCATTETAGLMSAADKAKLEGAVTEVIAGNGIAVVATESTTPKVSVKLDETTSKLDDEDEAHSGLKATEDGLKIDESLTWIFNCGDSTSNIE